MLARTRFDASLARCRLWRDARGSGGTVARRAAERFGSRPARASPRASARGPSGFRAGAVRRRGGRRHGARRRAAAPGQNLPPPPDGAWRGPRLRSRLDDALPADVHFGAARHYARREDISGEFRGGASSSRRRSSRRSRSREAPSERGDGVAVAAPGARGDDARRRARAHVARAARPRRRAHLRRRCGSRRRRASASEAALADVAGARRPRAAPQQVSDDRGRAARGRHGRARADARRLLPPRRARRSAARTRPLREFEAVHGRARGRSRPPRRRRRVAARRGRRRRRSPCAVAAPPSGQAPPARRRPAARSPGRALHMLLDELRRLDRRLGAPCRSCARSRRGARSCDRRRAGRARRHRPRRLDEAERALIAARAVLAAIGSTERRRPGRRPRAVRARARRRYALGALITTV